MCTCGTSQRLARDAGGIDPARLSAACRRAAEAARSADGAQEAVDAALAAIDEGLGGAYVSALAIEHGLLWVVGACGWSMLSDGLDVGDGVVGRAVTEERARSSFSTSAPTPTSSRSQQASSRRSPFPSSPTAASSACSTSRRPSRCPKAAQELLGGLPDALAPHVAALRTGGTPDLASLARFFVYVSSLREPRAIAEVVVRAVARILSLDTCQISLVAEGLMPVEASWQAPGGSGAVGARSRRFASCARRLEGRARCDRRTRRRSARAARVRVLVGRRDALACGPRGARLIVGTPARGRSPTRYAPTPQRS